MFRRFLFILALVILVGFVTSHVFSQEEGVAVIDEKLESELVQEGLSEEGVIEEGATEEDANVVEDLEDEALEEVEAKVEIELAIVEEENITVEE